MSKKIQEPPLVVSNNCELISSQDISYLEGQLKTFIDSIISSESNPSQNKASKDIVNTLLWHWYRHITNHFTDHLSDKKKWYKENKLNK